MSNFFATAIASQSNKRYQRISTLSTCVQPTTSAVAVPSGYDVSTGLFKATTVDGGEIQYKEGNATAQPNQISVTFASGSLVGFGDWL
jgi:hypothetical protein